MSHLTFLDLTSYLICPEFSKLQFLFFNRSKSKDEGTYIVRLELLEPKSDLLTFAIFSRDYSKDMVSGGTNEYNRLIAISLISGVAAICFIKIMLL